MDSIPNRRPPAPPSPLRRDLRVMVADGVLFSVMVGIGETYFPAFVLALGMREIWSALVATVPMLAGALLQLAAPWGVGLLRSRRRWVAGAAMIQAAAFLPMVAGAAAGRLSLTVLYAAATLYWAAGLSTGPAWNTWVSQIVPRRLRARFFARRGWGAQLGTLAGLLGGGALLQLAAGRQRALWGFAVLFLIACVCRVFSSRLLWSQSEPRPPREGERAVIGRTLVRRFTRDRSGRVLLYLVTLTASVAIAAPFFNPYMLKHLHFTYTQYMTLIGAAFLARVAALPGLGAIAGKVGAMRILRACGAGITVIPALWLFSHDFYYLLALQAITGVVWGGYEYSSFLLLPRDHPGGGAHQPAHRVQSGQRRRHRGGVAPGRGAVRAGRRRHRRLLHPFRALHRGPDGGVVPGHQGHPHPGARAPHGHAHDRGPAVGGEHRPAPLGLGAAAPSSPGPTAPLAGYPGASPRGIIPGA